MLAQAKMNETYAFRSQDASQNWAGYDQVSVKHTVVNQNYVIFLLTDLTRNDVFLLSTARTFHIKTMVDSISRTVT